MTERTLKFVGVGPAKTRTTWLHDIFAQHPALSMPSKVKETYFFDSRFSEGWDWYLRHFKPGVQPLAEFCPSYFQSPAALHHLSNFPGVKIIITLRDPLKRSLSHFWHSYAKGRYRSFEHALIKNPNIVWASRYSVVVADWRRAFGERCVVVNSDTLVREPNVSLPQLCEFLDLPFDFSHLDLSKIVNEASSPRIRWLGAAAAAAAKKARASGLHGVTEVGKALGLKKAFFRRRDPGDLDSVIDESARDVLASALAAEEGWEDLCDF
ncbi:MAG: sulfotransferase [Gammaproteobacteria bacterium]